VRTCACPGLIDAHVHIEISMLPPHRFADAMLPHSVTTVVCEPHEIANATFVLFDHVAAAIDRAMRQLKPNPWQVSATARATQPAPTAGLPQRARLSHTR